MDAAAGEVHQVNFAGRVLAPAHDAIGGAGQLAVAGLGGSLSRTIRPDAAGVEIAINILSLEFRQALAMVNEATGDRAEIGMRMFDHGFEDGRGPNLAF